MKNNKENKIKTVPENYTAVTPWIVSPSTIKQMAFLKAVFNAEELPNSRITNEDGAIIHVVMKLDDAMIMLFDAREGWPPSPSYLNIYVDDIDAALEKAMENGAITVTNITPLWFGEKVCRILDPFGNLFWINERVEEVDMTDKDEIKRRSSTAEAAAGIQYIQAALNEAFKKQREFFEDTGKVL